MNKKQFLGASLHTGLYCEKYGLIIGMYNLAGWCIKYMDEKFARNATLSCVVPIARPLSDLTELITHNGKTFIPIAELAKTGGTSYDKLIISNLKFDYRFVNLEYLPVWMYRKLIEWHFNLMDESEPFIPVTKEFNPYK